MTDDKMIASLQSKIAKQRSEIARLEQIISRVLHEKLGLLSELHAAREKLKELQ
jgi:predicted  nucleic acid-binding Zn-ribbon protein